MMSSCPHHNGQKNNVPCFKSIIHYLHKIHVGGAAQWSMSKYNKEANCPHKLFKQVHIKKNLIIKFVGIATFCFLLVYLFFFFNSSPVRVRLIVVWHTSVEEIL